MIETLWIDSRDFRCILILPFTFLFLQFEWNASDWAFLDSFHQVSGETSNLVAETFWWDDSYFITDFLVGVEVESETGIELELENAWERIGYLFDHDSRGLLDGTCTNATLRRISRMEQGWIPWCVDWVDSGGLCGLVNDLSRDQWVWVW